jgi:excisionase family DNA binding protein
VIRLDVRALVGAIAEAVRQDPALAAELRAALGAEAPAELVTVAEYARIRSVATSTVRRAIREGRLDATRIGRAVRVRADAEIGAPTRTATTTPRARALAILAGGGGR